MTRIATSLLPLSMVLGGCLFTGEDTRGLPCNVDEECGAGLLCIERVCGGPVEVGLTDTDTEGSMSGVEESGDPDGGEVDGGPQPDLCTANECKDADTIRLCLDDGKVSTIGCQGLCGPNADSLGCTFSPESGEDSCFCDFERSSCSNEGAQGCFGQSGLAVCQGGTWNIYDCDTVCIDAGYAGAAACGPGNGGADVCLCDNVCTHGAARCTGGKKLSYCIDGSWQQFGCDELCKDSGFSKGLACIFFPDPGDDSCACL